MDEDRGEQSPPLARRAVRETNAHATQFVQTADVGRRGRGVGAWPLYLRVISVALNHCHAWQISGSHVNLHV
ncbi:hypothetical protein ACS49_04140 [Bacillus cereus]|nr:hypothetical protein ACS49_04140 [Bacillus cereus]